MKQLLLSLLILSCFAANAKNYYISNVSGNDANNGTSITTPWKTISKLNSFTGLVAGDQVLFNRGETFYGSIVVNKSGAAGNPIVYSAYGTGENPVITGFTKVGAWTNVGTNLWESSTAVSTLNDVNCVVINNVNTAMGRFPNTNYFITDTHVATTSITSASLSGATDWTGADVVMRTWNFAIARNLITASSGSTLTYKNTTPDNGHDGYGFFIENDVRTLDVQNEWYYNPSTKKIRIYSTSTPANVQLSTADTLVYMVAKNNLTFDGIDFTGSNRRAFYIGSCANVTIQNCDFNYHGLYAIWGGNNHGAASSNFNFNHNTINHVNSQGIVMQSEFVNPYIGYNTFKNCGVLPGMFKVATAGGQWDGAYGSIFSIRTNGLIVEYNSIDSTGYTGIHFTGNNTRVNNNEVAHHCLLLMDGGGIYTWTGPSGTPTTGSKIYNNIVHDGFGNNTGTTEAAPLCQGLYLDENTRNTEVYNNTFFDNPYGGIFSNSNTNCNFHDNTCYNNVIDQILCSSNYSLPTEKEQSNILKNNIFVARTATQLTAKFTTSLDDIANFFTECDSNYYARPIDDKVSFFTSINRSASFGHYTLAQWQAYIKVHDVHSNKSPKAITDVNDLRIEYNASTVSKTVPLDGNYIDVRNKAYNGSITLAPYTSAVLIRNGAATANKAPTANASSDQTITLPLNTVSLSGTATDADGSISTYSWTKISGPSAGAITSAGTASTTVTALVEGVYKFQFKVTDNGGATDLDTIQVTVNPANAAPIAKAGSNQTITLPTNSISLAGSATDSDGSISAYSWTKIAGPSAGTITNATAAATTVTGMAAGVYQFQLKVTDNDAATDLDTIQVTVNPANVAPTGNAGADQTIKLPVNTITLSGSGTDTDGSISAYSWTKVSGPAGGAIASGNSAATTVTGLTAGVYTFQLKVTDNDDATDIETVQVTVNAANIAPTANAGADQSIKLPIGTVSLSGSGTDADGSISAYNWTKVSGPTGGTIANANSAATTVTGLTAGVYTFQLKVTDNETATGTQTVQVTVNAANIAPIGNAGADQSIKLPINTVSLSGSGTDTDGSISAYSWTKVSGPTGGTITNPNNAVTTVTGLTAGVYTFQLKVTDNETATDVETIQVTVNAANIAPIGNAGVDQAIKLPVNSVSLSGSGTDTDGSISAYSWTKVSGPASGTITNSNAAATTVTGLTAGVYTFQLKVTDNETATDVETIQVTVNAANIAPTANAGADQSIKLPVNSISLSGSGTDTDGSISAYSWTKVSGPASGTITNSNAAATTVTGLTAGVYTFQLKITDNETATGIQTVQVTVNAANIAPTANAGTDQTIKLPVNSISLSGSGTDTDGSISAYSWTKVSGPASGTITNSNAAATTVTGLTAGVYTFQLKITDNETATGIQTVQVTVNAANIAPTANAGTDQTIKLPVNSISLSGSGTDTDGSISAYSWTKVSGPASGTITNSNAATTTVTGLTAGVYTFQLKVTDNETATGVQTVQVTVNAANIAPTANAGADQTIKLPINTVSLTGSGADTDGSISAYSWTKVSGPTGGTITSATSAATTVTGLTAGVYTFQLKVTDNETATGVQTVQVTVNAANIAPTANAGTDQTIKLPINAVSLTGSGADTDGSISAYSWTKVSGPTGGTITSATSAATTVTGLTAGVYTFQLKVTDNETATGTQTIQVTVNAANIAPTANAGTDQTIKLPINTISLTGSGADTDGTISAYSWTKVSGSASGTITNANAATTTVTGLTAGVYTFQLKVTDNETATGVQTVQVTVNAANIAPTANAGTDQTIKLPINTISLTGSGADTDGSISAYSWTKVSGSASGTITNANAATTTVTGLTAGVYTFQLKVTDNETATAVKTVQVTVNAANIAPTAKAGADQTIKLPINTVSLTGSGADTDGSISAYSWTKVSGPASGTITNANTATTTVTGLTAGVYTFQLKVTDNETATAVKTVQVTVNAANIAPTANAGADQTIKLPINIVSLTGSGVDTDGSISAYSWTKVSGPASGIITNANSATTTVTGLTAGIYTFQLKVTDNETATAVQTVQVTVNAANVLPTANAGADQTIKLPVSSISLSGSGADTDGNISAYSWTKISGPASGTITNATSAATTVTGLTQGVYQFVLKVTDNETATSADTIQITVNAANIIPTANAGTDKSIKLPVNTVSLSGSGTDTDGSISAYSWTKISGPSAGTITSANTAATTVTGLTQGIYQFVLKVTDNETATSVDTVQVTVNADNIVPTANAGADKTIKLPINSVTFSGTGTDTDGNISTYSWTKISGPASGTITNAASAATTVTGLTQGVYQFVLKVTDNETATSADTIQVTVNADNILPTANAGPDQSIKLPVNTVSLTGGGTDTDGSITSYSWTKISGPASGVITNANAATATVTGLTQGVYQFELKVTDNETGTSLDTIQVTVNAANILPTANAGADQSIKLPINTISLTGSGTDTDGSISAYSWTMISGPASGTITNANSSATTATGLTQGVYQFVLKVTDNETATAMDTIQVTVTGANIPPAVSAGADQSVKLPINTVSLTGIATDTDGSISAYSWTIISGPASGTITNAASAATTVTGLVEGIYQFELKVTDNETVTTTDTIQVTVSAANMPPSVNAGADQTIKLPINSVTLSGSGTDTDGMISAYSWTKVSGPASGTITDATSGATTVTGLTEGVYQFELKVTDNETVTAVDTIQVTVVANVAPVANAGNDQSITLPADAVSLNGSGSDSDGSISAYSWTMISGPAAGTITDATSAVTTVTGLVEGVYQFELKVTDNNGAATTDTIQVTVGGNIPPAANAGADQLITLPVNTITSPTSTILLNGNGTDTDGSIAEYTWTLVSGPESGAITDPAAPATKVTGMVEGVYQFELKVTDNNGATATDTVQVTVMSPNVAPTVNAGIDQSITLPIDVVSLNGNGIDTDGSIAAYSWKKVSGPATGVITNASSAATTVTGLTPGVYQFELKATDDNGATVADTIQVTVNAANILPTANAGTDQSITLPVNTVSLSGNGADTDGSISGYGWEKIAGPSAGAITSANAAATTVTGLTQGVYQFRLKVTDNKGATAFDTVQVSVTATTGTNVTPIANAGDDVSTVLPVNTATLKGTAVDPDGTISTYRWMRISGPALYTMTNPASATSTIASMVQGVYRFQFRVTDNKGAMAYDTIQVTVNAATNVLPKSNAGADQTTTLPTNSVTLTGSGTDPDGNITLYSWMKLSGPVSYIITNPISATTTIKSMVQGVYKFQLKVYDNRGGTAFDTVQVTVNAATNVLPSASAGADQITTLPTNAVTLKGTGTDSDGSISSYRWMKISGPLTYAVASPASASTIITSMVAGTYKFQLRVTDNRGGMAFDTVQVTINAAANILPKSNAGADQMTTLPANSVTLAGSGTDTDGNITLYSWMKISGPASYVIANPISATTTIKLMIQGVYKFQLKVYDNRGATAIDTVQVTVNAAPNVAPTANAGTAKTITLPVNTATLIGSGADQDGKIASYSWTKISGPATFNIVNSASPVTDVSGLTEGIYQFQLKVTDNNAATALDTVDITVNSGNIAPSAEAGANQTIVLPRTITSINGSAVDPDGVVTSYKWTKVSGPSAILLTPNAKSSSVIGLVQGTYKFKLEATDNKGAVGTDSMLVTVTGNSIVSPINTLASLFPGKYDLKPRTNTVYQNVPNPVINSTTIKYEVVEKAPVKIMVYNTVGLQVALLVNETKQPGVYQIQWKAGNIPSGNYYYTVIIGNTVTTKSMLKVD